MGNVHMEATQINYRGGSKKMSVEEAIKAAGTEITPEEKTWIDSIPTIASGKADNDVIAPEFDSEEGVYAIGDLVMHEGKLYEFTTAHETAGDWDSTEVTEKTVADEVNSVKSGLTTLDNEVNGDATTYPYADVITIEDAIPSNLADCSVKIEPVQSGSGDPSPENIRPITGHTEASVQRDGKNLLNVNSVTREYNDTWTALGGTLSSMSADGTLVLNAGTYTFSLSASASSISISSMTGSVITSSSNSDRLTFTLASKQAIKIAYGKNGGTQSFTAQIEVGSTVTPYVPYAGKTYTIALGDTVYGGTVDFNTGVMTVTMAQIASYDGETIGEPWISDRDVYADGTTPTIGAQVVYPLSTPTTIQLTPQQIQLLKGKNTLTASTGQISITVNGVSGSIGAVQEQVNELAEQLPDAPTTDGTYNLQVIVASGVPTYSWVSGS